MSYMYNCRNALGLFEKCCNTANGGFGLLIYTKIYKGIRVRETHSTAGRSPYHRQFNFRSILHGACSIASGLSRPDDNPPTRSRDQITPVLSHPRTALMNGIHINIMMANDVPHAHSGLGKPARIWWRFDDASYQIEAEDACARVGIGDEVSRQVVCERKS